MNQEEKTAKTLIDNILNQDNPLHLPYDKAEFFPNKDILTHCFKTIRKMLFVHTAGVCAKNREEGQQLFTAQLKEITALLEKEVKKTFCLFCSAEADCDRCDKKASDFLSEFLDYLPTIQQLALTDITAAYNGDPAARNNYEILLCYPGLKAITYQRMAHFFHKKNIMLLPRLITEHAHTVTGIDIHPGAQIGPYFFIDHGTGVVIGETTVIGKNVKIYQGVTLGAKSFPLDENGNPQKGIKRHPNVSDNVTIYAGATVLGNITIGEGSTIAANAWITKDVPPLTVQK